MMCKEAVGGDSLGVGEQHFVELLCTMQQLTCCCFWLQTKNISSVCGPASLDFVLVSCQFNKDAFLSHNFIMCCVMNVTDWTRC